MSYSKIIRQTAEKYIKNMIVVSDPLKPGWNRENVIFCKKAKWNYMDSCIIRAILMYENEENLEYALKYIDCYVDDDGNIPTMNAEDYNLDNICGGMNLIHLYNATQNEKYRRSYEKIYKNQLEKQPRLSCGNYWHKAIYPNQLWLDSAYMALPFLAVMGKIRNDDSLVNDAVMQVKNIYSIMKDCKTGLYYHGYNETKDTVWADKKTGLSSEFWLRSNGWLCAGLADLYEITNDIFVEQMLKELIISMCGYQIEDGMLLQLPSKRNLENNYPETSGTLLFSYAVIKGYRSGILNEDILKCGIKALTTVNEKYIDNSAEIPVLKNICLIGGLGGKNNRDGSSKYYLSEKVVDNEAKGIAPFLMAVSEFSKI